jgi:hypothetical protein
VSLLIALFLLAPVRDQGIPNAPTTIQRLSWMAGCWRQEASTFTTIDEMWMAAAGEIMLGTSRTVGRDRVVEYEFMRIQSTQNGVTFFAQLPKQPETAFQLVTIDAQMVVFENAQHDFPQRVIYRLQGDTLTGRIEGTQDGKSRSAALPATASSTQALHSNTEPRTRTRTRKREPGTRNDRECWHDGCTRRRCAWVLFHFGAWAGP